MNPHVVVKPSDDRKQDFVEILEDWDRHYHDRISLDPRAWHTTVPVKLLDSKAHGDLSRFSVANSVENIHLNEGAPSLYGFSLVFFNKTHTVALVYATHWCGVVCGEGYWVALTLQNGTWNQLDWNTGGWIS